MAKHTAFIVPHRLNFGPGFGRTPSRAGKQLRQTVWQSKTGTVSEIHLGKGSKKPISAHGFEGLDFGKRLADHVLKKNKRVLVHALMQSFRRHFHMLYHLRHFRCQLRQCRVGVTPGAKGDEGEKEFASQLRRAFDKAGTTCSSFDVVGSKEVC